MSKGPDWRPATSDIPRSPGVYRFRDEQGRVIYVGKAKSLRARLTSYFQDPEVLHPRTAQMVSQARSVQWTVVGSEIEALTLEFQWIKQFDPYFNVMYRDDKSYPYLVSPFPATQRRRAPATLGPTRKCGRFAKLST